MRFLNGEDFSRKCLFFIFKAFLAYLYRSLALGALVITQTIPFIHLSRVTTYQIGSSSYFVAFALCILDKYFLLDTTVQYQSESLCVIRK